MAHTVPRSCLSRCWMPSSHSCAVDRCEASTREDSSFRLLENFSICSMTPFRDLGRVRSRRPGDPSTSPSGGHSPDLARTLCARWRW